MLKEELRVATKIAQEAGALLLRYYAEGVEVKEKIGADNMVEPVTIADKRASELIIKGLREAFPEDGILSEEAFDDKQRLSKQRVWVIDPMDGTLGFIKRQDDFCVQIGLTEAGKAILGVVFVPVENVLYYASAGAGAFRVDAEGTVEQMRVSGKTDLREMNLATSHNHKSPKNNLIRKRLGVKREIQRGSVGIKVSLLTTRICDLYIHLSSRTKFWDTCAPQIILEEAGGRFTDLFGGEFRYDLSDVQNHNGLVATNGAAHDAALKELKHLLREFGRLRVLPEQ